jgi:hypothetical protein
MHMALADAPIGWLSTVLSPTEPRHAQDRFAIHVLKRQVQAVRPRIDGDHVCLGGDKPFGHLVQCPSALVEHRHDAALGCHVEAPHAAIKGQHVRVVPHRLDSGHPQGRQIEHQEPGVAVTGDEGQAVRRVNEQTVIVLAAPVSCQPIAVPSHGCDHDVPVAFAASRLTTRTWLQE